MSDASFHSPSLVFTPPTWRTLIATALTEVRMAVLLELLEEAVGDLLDAPRLTQQKIVALDKLKGKTRQISPPPAARIRWGRKGDAQ